MMSNSEHAVAGTGIGNVDQGVAVAPSDFGAFFEAEHDRLFGALYLVTGQRQDAEELMQEAFLKVWERWSKVRDLESPTGYLYRTAMNAFRMRSRRAVVVLRRHAGRPSRTDPIEIVETQDAVDRALATLTSRQRAALVLNDLLGFPSDEVAPMLGVSASTVRGLVMKARQGFRRAIEVADE